jgi:hypothetical protein
MPCYDERNSPAYINEHEIRPLQREILRLQDRNNNLTRMLCELCTALQRAGTESKMYPHGYIDRVTGLTQWWKKHQELDRKREWSPLLEKTIK